MRRSLWNPPGICSTVQGAGKRRVMGASLIGPRRLSLAAWGHAPRLERPVDCWSLVTTRAQDFVNQSGERYEEQRKQPWRPFRW
jgi:hypothetical protein